MMLRLQGCPMAVYCTASKAFVLLFCPLRVFFPGGVYGSEAINVRLLFILIG